jgi:hypothetical protein
MSAAVTMPARLVRYLRKGLRMELASPSERLAVLTLARESQTSDEERMRWK